MKKLVAIALLLTLFSGCSNTAGNSPKFVVAAFVEASKQGDMESLKKYVSSQDVSLLEAGDAILAKLDPAQAKEMKEKMTSQFRDKTKGVTIDIKDEKVDGDNATVNVNFTSNEKTENKPFSLVKENGQWKISLLSIGMNESGMSKEKMAEGIKQMKEGLKNLTELTDTAGGMGELKNINTDSLRKMIGGSKAQLEKLKEVLKANKQTGN